jgi:hypothetical protein
MPQIMAQTSYFQAQLLIVSYNIFIITISSQCLHHFSSKMANPVTLKMDGSTTASSNTLQNVRIQPCVNKVQAYPKTSKTGN